MNFLKTIITYLFLINYNVKCVNILGLMGIPSPSHHHWNTIVVKELAKQGYNITILSVDLPKTDIKNVHYIHMNETYSELKREYDFVDIIKTTNFQEIPLVYGWYKTACKGNLKSNGIKTLLNYPKDFKFDLIIHDFTGGPCLLGFVHKFNYPPLIGLTAYKMNPAVIDQVGGHSFPGYIPYATTKLSIEMNFFERLFNSGIYFYDYLYKTYIFLPQIEKIVLPHFDENLPDLRSIEKQTQLALINTHPSIDYAETIPPNIIEVAGLQIQEPKSLPNDIEMFINKSKNGAVLISFGTNIDNSIIGKNKLQIIFDAISQIPEYNFLWKNDPKSFTNVIPENILIQTWLPQNDILANPKVKAFVSHAGALSTQEATWYGVPLVTVPFVVDQIRNSFTCTSAGVAMEVNFLTMTVDVLKDTIRTVLEDPKFKENMKIRSVRFRDRPMKPLATALYWINYVLRHQNANHLKSPNLHLDYLRSNLYDIALFLIVFVFVFLWILYKISVILINKILRPKSDVNKKKTN